MELVVVASITLVLASIVLVSLAQVRSTTRGFICKNNLKTVAFEFAQFADGTTSPNRGESNRFGRRGFRIEDFQEKLYHIDEFWKGPKTGETEYQASDGPLICPTVQGKLRRMYGLACSEYAVGPSRNVSIGFNMRLDRASRQILSRWVLEPVLLTDRILQHISVPIAFDVDGSLADDLGTPPYYSAPPAGDPGKYGSGRYWFPGTRHNQKMNAVFVGGHVLSSGRPENEPGWNWRYQPPPSGY